MMKKENKTIVKKGREKVQSVEQKTEAKEERLSPRSLAEDALIASLIKLTSKAKRKKGTRLSPQPRLPKKPMTINLGGLADTHGKSLSSAAIGWKIPSLLSIQKTTVHGFHFLAMNAWKNVHFQGISVVL